MFVTLWPSLLTSLDSPPRQPPRHRLSNYEVGESITELCFPHDTHTLVSTRAASVVVSSLTSELCCGSQFSFSSISRYSECRWSRHGPARRRRIILFWLYFFTKSRIFSTHGRGWQTFVRSVSLFVGHSLTIFRRWVVHR